MVNRLNQVRERTDNYSNHYQKYLRILDRNMEMLIGVLEKGELTEQIHLWFPSVDLDNEFSILTSLQIGGPEKLRILGTYYALKYLQLNISTLDLLRLQVLSDVDKTSVYQETLLRFGFQFRVLSRAYMKSLLTIFLNRRRFDDFVMIGVGTRSDQDDIDVGVVDLGQSRKPLNKAITKLNIEMIKNGSRLHFHLSEHVIERSFAANIQEFSHLLDKEIQDFVIINELLGAAVILGNGEIFKEFQTRVTNRYYYHPHGNNQYHEGYLRGILGEIRDLLALPKPIKSLDPKRDGLRIIKGLLYAFKTIHGIDEVNAWRIIDRLIEIDKDRHEIFQRLRHCLSFYEIVRFIYQILVAQEEDIPLEKANLRYLNQVAYYLGNEPIGVMEPYQQMIISYYQWFDTLRSIMPPLIDSVAFHLARHSRFLPLVREEEKDPVLRFIDKLGFFRGTGFWDDILKEMKGGDGTRFFSSLKGLDPEKRIEVINILVGYFLADFDNLIRLFLIIRKNGDEDLCQSFLKTMIDQLKALPDVKHRLINVFNLFPDLINHFLSDIGDEQQRIFTNVLEGKMPASENESLRGQLITLARIHNRSSNYFRIFFKRITNRYPDMLRYLEIPGRLDQFSQGILGRFNSTESSQTKVDLLGDYYDCEFTRTGLMALNGESPVKTNAEYTRFSDLYLHLLFETIGETIDERMFRAVKNRIAIYAAGGHGREQAFDDDYDLIIITDSREPNLRYFENQLVARMGRELTKRDMIPHYRFADFTGSYTLTIEELEEILSRQRDSLFVDQSQVLGARIIVGSVRMERIFEREILDKYIFARRKQYIKDLIAELNSRHEDELSAGAISNNIKEGLGGLRDVEMFVLICKAKTLLRDPINSRIFESLKRYLGKDDFPDIKDDFLFLKNIRDLYRLTTAANDEIDPIGLERIAPIVGLDTASLRKAISKRRDRIFNAIKDFLNNYC